MQLAGQGHEPSTILPKKNPSVLYRKLGEPMDVPYSYGEKKKIYSRRSHLQNLFGK